MESADSEQAHTGFTLSRPFRSFAETTREAVLRPERFYRNLSQDDPPKNPVIFAVLCLTASFFLTYLASPPDPSARGESTVPQYLLAVADENLGLAAATVAFMLIVAALFAVLSISVGTAVQHLAVRAFVWPRQGFGTTLRINAYSCAILLLSWIPIVGYLAGLYGSYLVFVGIRELHSTATTRALLAVLVLVIPWLIGLGLYISGSLA